MDSFSTIDMYSMLFYLKRHWTHIFQLSNKSNNFDQRALFKSNTFFLIFRYADLDIKLFKYEKNNRNQSEQLTKLTYLALRAKCPMAKIVLSNLRLKSMY